MTQNYKGEAPASARRFSFNDKNSTFVSFIAVCTLLVGIVAVPQENIRKYSGAVTAPKIYLICALLSIGLLIVGCVLRWKISAKVPRNKPRMVIATLLLLAVAAVLSFYKWITYGDYYTIEADTLARDGEGTWWVAFEGEKASTSPAEWKSWTGFVPGKNDRVFVGDVDGDGDSDVVAKDENATSDGAWVVGIQGGGTFDIASRDGKMATWITGFGISTQYEFYLLDMNADCRVDLIAKGADGTWSVAISEGNNHFKDTFEVWLDPKEVVLGDQSYTLMGDLNGDRRADIVAKGADGIWTVALAQENFKFVVQPSGWIDSEGVISDATVAFLGDVSGDNKADLVFKKSNGDWYVAKSTGRKFETTPDAWLSAWPPEQNIAVQLADINGDRMADLVARGTKGTWYYAKSNETRFAKGNDPWIKDWKGDLFFAPPGEPPEKCPSVVLGSP